MGYLPIFLVYFQPGNVIFHHTGMDDGFRVDLGRYAYTNTALTRRGSVNNTIETTIYCKTGKGIRWK